ncbi:MAG: potassium transporter TrkH [Planctomycetales bacterium]|nr:potassium transporter TrkH [Planctomycetales bacterium]
MGLALAVGGVNMSNCLDRPAFADRACEAAGFAAGLFHRSNLVVTRMPKVAGSLVKYPARVSFFWYLGLIVAGTLLLRQPLSRGNPVQPISWLDAAFTSTSAACVTGLAVRSTPNDFSLFGQIVILVLIQLGGIGIMTVTTFVVFHLGARARLRHRAILTQTLGADEQADLNWILRNVLLITFLFEGIGFALLAFRNLFEMPRDVSLAVGIADALWHALFHSVSAFCNAGFALHDDSLTRYQGDFYVNGVISVLIIAGGIGFPVILDVKHKWQSGSDDWWHDLHIHSKTMLIGTAALLVGGAVVFTILEWDGVLRDLPWHRRVLVPVFHSVSCRTAGFNTIELARLTNASLFVSILLMAIGAGACSTGGGIKVSTVMLLVYQAWSRFRGYERVHVFGRTIPRPAIDRATATVMLFSVAAVIALTLLLMIEQSSVSHLDTKGVFLEAIFEVASALGTVGLSTGLTTQLTNLGRVIIIVLMFLGRLGPISVFAALSRNDQEDPVQYAKEEPLVG